MTIKKYCQYYDEVTGGCKIHGSPECDNCDNDKPAITDELTDDIVFKIVERKRKEEQIRYENNKNGIIDRSGDY